jgi:hypothetical protein
MLQTRILRVLVASPGDVQAERELVPSILDELNRTICSERDIRLECVRWETDTYPGFNQLGPQGLIDPILRIEDSDVLIGIFWKRFGSPISTGETGTENEIRRAYESWKSTHRPQIMIYFNQKNYRPRTKADLDQWGRVLDFRDHFPDQGLWWQYNGKAQFKELLRNHLTNYLLNRYPSNPVPQITPNPVTSEREGYFSVQDRVIAEHDRTFVGRAEVQQQFDDFLKSEPNGYFIVRGAPGQGKTALSCHLVRNRGYVHHLISRTGGRTDTRLILRSLLAQVRSRTPSDELRESLPELTKTFEEALSEAASPGKPFVVVIDALDELPPTAGDPPYLVYDGLPDGVFFFVTCRPGDRLDRLSGALFATPHQIHELGPLSLSEMQAVLRSRKPDIAEAVIERIAEASQGNPLYLRSATDEIGSSPGYNLEHLPLTIEGFFRRFTGILREENPIRHGVLAFLSVARTSLSVRELSAIGGWLQRDTDDQGIRPIRQFLLDIDGSYTFFHMKFHEFVTANILYEDELRNAHRAIAQWLQRPGNESNRYRLASLAYHLYESGERAGLLGAIDSAFLAEKVRRLGYAVLEDVELCTRALLESSDPAVVERCVSMVEGLRELAGGDIISASAQALQPDRAGAESFRTRMIEPPVPRVKGVDVFAGVLPKAEIPADFFEILAHDDRLAVAIGDAPSVGLKSAFAARFIANLFRRFVETSRSLDLAELLSRIDSTVANYEYFQRISMQCLDLDPGRGVLQIASAGHPYPVHYSSRKQKCDVLLVGGDLIHDTAAQPAAESGWRQYGVEIESGDVLVLVSDGLTEGHLLAGDPYGYRFRSVIEAGAKEGASAIGHAILDGWRAHPREEDSADDVSVIVLKVLPGIRE